MPSRIVDRKDTLIGLDVDKGWVAARELVLL